jgi:c-di-GMP-specific phosphodiesterase
MNGPIQTATRDDLRDGLAAGAFEPLYQPVARLADAALAGFEALARWRQAGGALAPTASFLDVALEHDLLGEISRAILMESTKSFARWRRTSPGAEHLFLSVNVAGRDLERGLVLPDVETALAISGLPPQALRLEVTEHQVLRDPVAAGATLAAVRALGVKVLLDDFGAGYSSLHWLMSLPADALKFDSVLVAGVHTDGAERKILKAMTALARDLGLETIAEGVESKDQRDALIALRVDYAQGYFYARAMSEADASALVAELSARADDPEAA